MMKMLLAKLSTRAKVFMVGGVAALASVSTVAAVTSAEEDLFCAAVATPEVPGRASGAPSQVDCFDSQDELDEFLVGEGVVFPEGYPPPG